jgi:hypothetical protein
MTKYLSIILCNDLFWQLAQDFLGRLFSVGTPFSFAGFSLRFHGSATMLNPSQSSSIFDLLAIMNRLSKDYLETVKIKDFPLFPPQTPR